MGYYKPCAFKGLSMRANTSVGEIIIHYEGRSYLLRPSFLAMSRLGDADRLDHIFRTVIMANNVFVYGKKYCLTNEVSNQQLACCLNVLDACCDNDLPDELIGWFQESRNGNRLLYRMGRISIAQIVVLAHKLITDGIIGRPIRRPKKKQQEDDDEPFSMDRFVGAAIAHLGLSTADAWGLTMIEFQRAMDAKFPVDKSKEPMSQERLEKLLERSREAHKRLPADRGKDKKVPSSLRWRK